MKILKKLSAVLVAFCIIPLPAFAADGAKVSVAYNAQLGEVTLRGYASGNTSIRTLKYDTLPDAVTESNLFTDYDQIYCSGDFTYQYFMPDAAPYGKYAVYVNDGSAGSPAFDTFIYYNKTGADEIVTEEINVAAEDEIYSEIDTNAFELGIDKSEPIYINNAENSSAVVFDYILPADDSSDFYNKFYSVLAINEMKGKSQSEVEELLKKYSDSIGINLDSYSELPDEQKADMCGLLASLDLPGELSKLEEDGQTASVLSVINRLEALSAVRVSENWKSVKTVFTDDYNDVLGDIMSSNSDYKSKMADDVFIVLLKNGDFSTYIALEDSFDEAVAAVKKSYDKNDDSSGSRGTGGSGGGKVTVSSDMKIPDDEYDEGMTGEQGEVVIETSFSTATLSGEKAAFTDIYNSSWEYEAVSSLGGSGIISGYEDGSFRSNNLITRAEFTKLIVSAFGIVAQNKEFSDVSADDWFYPYVSVASGAEIIKGYDGMFNPHANITREDAALIIYRISIKLGENYYGPVNFTDIDDVSLYAVTAIRGLGSAKIINGDSAMRFNPKSNLTRAEAAQLLYNFINKMAQ